MPRIDRASLSSGLYLYRIQTDDKKYWLAGCLSADLAGA
ncbi:T9SS type A sorting domain-containing protein [Phaeodactylibacter xiamenensis]